MDSIRFSFLPGQVITPGDTLTLELTPPRDVDQQTAQASVTLTFEGATVSREVTVESNTISIPTTGLAPGRYELMMGESQTTADDSSTTFMTNQMRPFIIRGHTYPIRSRDGRPLRIQNSVTLAIGHTSVEPIVMRIAPDKPNYHAIARPADAMIVEIVKAEYVDTSNDDTPIQLAFDENGREIDARMLLEAVKDRRFQKYGRIHEALWARVQTMGFDDLVDVVVWPQVPRAEFEDRLGFQARAHNDVDPLCERRQAILEHLKSLGAQISETENRVSPELQHVMVYVYATLKVWSLHALAEAKDVGAVMFNDRSAGVDLADSIAISRSNTVHTDLGFTGTGVKVAVFEQGPRNTSDLHFSDRFNPNSPGSLHARLTSAIIKNTQPNGPHGHAPGCDLYSANSFSNSALEWAIAQGCTVISQSFHRHDEARSGILQPDDILHDWMTLHAPYPTFLHAAGNFGPNDPDDEIGRAHV